ncbi:NUDIX domain-containing protein [Cellulomonas sp. P22]|uniref:NUDIX domain-containing protein n=1 Tax=Cellulomonas sp. P22 TaxID=3373189 RepID=UPI0037A0CEE5
MTDVTDPPTHATHATLAQDAEDRLLVWLPADPAQRALADEYVAFVRAAGAAAVARDGGPEHLTASCFVLTPDLTHVLLCYHRKGQFWVQLGGHVEATDVSMAAAAYREAREEGGIVALHTPDPLPVDVDRHGLSGSFGACRTHWDVGFVAFADEAAVPVTSAESEDVAWFAVDALPGRTPPGFGDRLATVLAELLHRRAAPAAT